MKMIRSNLRGIVLTWAVLTATFFWTSTMRILLKPEISSWSIFGVGGKGTGFNWQVKIAVAPSIIQWILLTEAFGRPYWEKEKRQSVVKGEL